MRSAGLVVALAVAALAAPGLRAEPKTAWIHVRVEEPQKESKVNVNVPMTVALAALSLAPEKVVSNGRVHLGAECKGPSVAELRRMWKELRASGDAEIVSVEEKTQTVKVARAGDKIRVHVEDPTRDEAVNVEVPVTAVDALFSGEGDDLNLRAALEEMQKLRGEVVRVDDKHSKVRIWIDEGI
jgi:hypothetical protein